MLVVNNDINVNQAGPEITQMSDIVIVRTVIVL